MFFYISKKINTSTDHILRRDKFSGIRVTAGGLTQGWEKLATTLEPVYKNIGKKITHAAVLNADETGWRINGTTHWIWCFAASKLCYYVID